MPGYDTRTAARIQMSGDDQHALCSYKEWMDCDAYGAVNDPGIVKDCGSTYCGSNGGVPEGKNRNVGEYSDRSRESQCCGDDAGEVYVDN